LCSRDASKSGESSDRNGASDGGITGTCGVSCCCPLGENIGASESIGTGACGKVEARSTDDEDELGEWVGEIDAALGMNTVMTDDAADELAIASRASITAVCCEEGGDGGGDGDRGRVYAW
jgi:hypothetical protein